MSKLFTLSVVTVAAAFLFSGPVVADGDKDQKFEGQYTVVSGERDGQALPQSEVAGKTVRITADKITVSDKDGKETMTCTYTVDAAQKPATIRTKGTGSNEGKNHVGLIERTKDNELRVILADGNEAPTEFKTKQGQAMWVLKPQ